MRSFPKLKASPLPTARPQLAYQCLASYVRKRLDSDKTPLLPDHYSYGKFLSLPFGHWLRTSSAGLKDRLMGPDVYMPEVPFERRQPIAGQEYDAKNEVNDDKVKVAIKGMLACYIQSFQHQYLCNPYELITAFRHPGALDLSDEKKLAIGIMREVLIIPQFGSMHNFWLTHARMVSEGGMVVGYMAPDSFHTTDARALISDDKDAMAMLSLCQDIGLPDHDFDISVQEVFRFKII